MCLPKVVADFLELTRIHQRVQCTATDNSDTWMNIFGFVCFWFKTVNKVLYF
jgi:hypothetical protein